MTTTRFSNFIMTGSHDTTHSAASGGRPVPTQRPDRKN
ncbi:hypothetical protein HY17_11920 [Hyphomonas sp. CY54-11-8]|nr:hypothetical protein HY17_11920 [Hyphomonas sp. CY54-11-8]